MKGFDSSIPVCENVNIIIQYFNLETSIFLIGKKARWSIKNKKVYKTNMNKQRTYSCESYPPAASILSPSVVRVKYDLATFILSISCQSIPSFLKQFLNNNIQFQLVFCEFLSFLIFQFLTSNFLLKKNYTKHNVLRHHDDPQ